MPCLCCTIVAALVSPVLVAVFLIIVFCEVTYPQSIRTISFVCWFFHSHGRNSLTFSFSIFLRCAHDWIASGSLHGLSYTDKMLNKVAPMNLE
jgi:hypothetical protein